MKAFKCTLIFLMAVVMIVGMTQSTLEARSGKEIGEGGGPFILDPHAPGQTFDFTMGLYYEEILGSPNCPYDPVLGEIGPDTKMTFFMRFETKKSLYSFGGVAPNVCYWDFGAQQAAVEDFIKTDVIPYLAAQGVIDDPYACFAIKDVSNVVENVGVSFITDTPVFTLMDVVIAIDKKNSCPPSP